MPTESESKDASARSLLFEGCFLGNPVNLRIISKSELDAMPGEKPIAFPEVSGTLVLVLLTNPSSSQTATA